MKQQQALKAAIAAIALSLSGTAFAGSASGEALGVTCAGCHGTNGVSTGPATPTIAGMSKTYIVDTMENYKTGDNYSTIMGRIAKGYSTAEFEAMGDFFSKQSFSAADQASGKNAKAGKKIHKKSCKKCHEDGGTSADDDSGFLSGQWAPYLKYTFTDLMNGEHVMGKKMKKQMKKMHEKHGDAGIAALLDYYSSNK
ncbi:MAG: c-type cytochrome [Gammaproteobacteria bacterium]|nr:c-type cytochrome [Gammaproteobacteria bacterium]